MEKEEIVARLVAIEPDLPRVMMQLGPADVATVAELVTDARPRVRANALTLQSLIDEDGFKTSFVGALTDPEKIVKLQALVSLGNVSPELAASLADVTRQYLADPDTGVRKLAIKAASRSFDEETASTLQRIANDD